jgi:hypothetical protein
MAFSDSQDASLTRIKESAPGTILVVTLAGTVTKGDAVGYSSGWVRALATAASVVQIMGVALESGVSGNLIPVCFGDCILSGRLTGMTAAGSLYVAEGTSNGMYTATVPTTSSDANTLIGYSLTATDALIMPLARARSTV